MKKYVDKTIFGKIAFGIFAIHTVLSLVSIILTLSDNHKIFQYGFRMASVLLIVYPIIGGIIYVIVSIIGMIKNKKLLPYLICPIISIIIWLILVGSVVAYV